MSNINIPNITRLAISHDGHLNWEDKAPPLSEADVL